MGLLRTVYAKLFLYDPSVFVTIILNQDTFLRRTLQELISVLTCFKSLNLVKVLNDYSLDVQ